MFDFYCSSNQFYVLLNPYLCSFYFLYLNLYVLGDDLSFKPNIYAFLSASELRVRLVPLNLSPLVNVLLKIPSFPSFVDFFFEIGVCLCLL